MRVSAVVELAIGVALLAIAPIVLDLLIGPPSHQQAALVGRVLGAALLALGIAGGLAGGEPVQRGIWCAFVVYNAATAAILLVAGVSGAADGLLLWPVVALHAALAMALVAGWLRS